MDETARKSWLVVLSRRLAVMIPAAVGRSMEDDEEEAALLSENPSVATSNGDGETDPIECHFSTLSSREYDDDGVQITACAMAGGKSRTGSMTAGGSVGGADATAMEHAHLRYAKKRASDSSTASSCTAEDGVLTAAQVAALAAVEASSRAEAAAAITSVPGAGDYGNSCPFPHHSSMSTGQQKQ